MPTSRIISLDNSSRIVRDLLNNNQAAIKELYINNYPKIRSMILQNNGTEQDSKDIYQDAFVALWKRLQNNSFEMKSESAIGGYLYTVSKNKWMDHLRSSGYKKNISLDVLSDSGFEKTSEENIFDKKEDNTRVKKAMMALKELGQECRELLKMFYYEKQSMNDISIILKLDAASTRNKKYRCMKRLRDMTLNQPDKN